MVYLQAYLDTVERRATDESSTPARMTHYVEDMLDDLKRAHRIREEQLSSAANSYRLRLEKVVNQHEHLLVAYRCLLTYLFYQFCLHKTHKAPTYRAALYLH